MCDVVIGFSWNFGDCRVGFFLFLYDSDMELGVWGVSVRGLS